ncbi:hypothetical protein BGHDH14_bgh01705 [Blumeria hordei DH14]|uniref:Endonuclease/exonuclease/phosphatase domain-containing protein n=1 Tax=Blumeria graminis f. sp. hordei (strain DH14) TaxID=546991 RepID=N1JCQ5_BLUG1|nr:hypothetical protein BGHDH14_bgh01705 [Blumeria hordei DH14]
MLVALQTRTKLRLLLHPSFESFTPVNDWNIRPRVLTSARKENNLTFTQDRLNSSSEDGRGDILFLTNKGPENISLQIINIYNAPSGATNTGAGVSFLLSLTNIYLNPKSLLTGDFNIHYANWNPSCNGSPSTQSSDLIFWLEDKDLFLLSEVNVPTHNLGNVLDLCFTSSSLLIGGAHATVQQDLDVSSDHSPLLINIPCQVRSNPSSPRLCFATIQPDTFFSLLRSHLDSFTLLSEKSGDSLDKRAEDIIQILYSCFSGSA